MAVTIGNARISEKGTVNGAKGDQTGREVMTQAWSSGGTWQYVIRPKDASKAKKIADTMKAACANNNIGYSQADRLSLYNIVSKNGWNISKAGKCNCDCSSLVAVCVNAAGIKVSASMYTGNELSVLKATGAFTVYSSSDYTKSSSKLRTGDILLRSGHTAIVTSGAVALNTSSSSSSSTKKASSSTSSTTKKTTTSSSSSIGKNVTSTSTKTIQTMLNKVGKYGLSVDGAYGAKTTAAVKDFQKKNNLTTDGIVGNATLTKLNAAYKKATTSTSTSTAKKTTTSSKKKGVVTATVLNVRKQPKIVKNNNIATYPTIKKGKEVTIESSVGSGSNKWYLVSITGSKGTKKGYVKASFIKVK